MRRISRSAARLHGRDARELSAGVLQHQPEHRQCVARDALRRCVLRAASSGNFFVARLGRLPARSTRLVLFHPAGNRSARSSQVPQYRRSAVLAMIRSEEHTSELQSLMRISYAVFCLKKKKNTKVHPTNTTTHHKHTKQ